MQGFKSFADKTVLEFEHGVAAVVGPNGSGKSNISDAIRWVLGEMSAKSLRGSNMQDVIFSGTQTRKAVNFAEVSLVLDNSDHIFPIDFEEVIVTRRVFRSGETAYQINRANCRLKDIHELFMDTGLGRDGYSIIGQGNVAQILSTKAEDRRSLFEEAAGIAKYKHRKEESENKLKHVEENLIRIGDVKTELENQIGPLQNQSEKARKYLVLYEEYKQLDINMSLKNLDDGKNKIEDSKNQIESVSAQLQDTRSKESGLAERLDDLYKENQEKEEQQNIKSILLRENESKSMEISNEISIAKNNIKNHDDLRVRLEKEIETECSSIDNRHEQIEKLVNEISQKQSSIQNISDTFSSVQSENDDMIRQISDLKEQLDNKKSDAVELRNQISFDKAQLSGIDTLRNNFLQRKEVVETELVTHTSGVENMKFELENSKKEITQKSEKLKNMRMRAESQQENLKKIELKYIDMQNKSHTLQADYQSSVSKKKMLEGMENAYEGYARSVKTVLTAQELKKLSIYGTLSGLINVDEKYVTAIETALGGTLQNIVVESEDDAKQAIEYLRNQKAGRATFLPVTAIKGRELEQKKDVSACKGFLGIANNLVKCDNKYDGIIKSLLGRVVVMDSIDNAIAVSKQFGYKFKVVTLLGDVLNAGGSMAGGSANKNASFLSRANEIKTLSAHILAVNSEMVELTRNREQTEKEKETANIQLSTYIPLIREYEDALLKLEGTVEHLGRTLTDSGVTEQSLRTELEQINEQLSKTGDDAAKLINSIRSNETNANEIEEDIQRQDEEYEELVKSKENHTQLILEHTAQITAIQQEIALANAQIQQEKNLIAQGDIKIKEKNIDIERIKNENILISNTIKEKEIAINDIQKLSDKISAEIDSIKQDKNNLIAEQQKIQGSNKGLTDTLLLLQQELSRLESKHDRLNIEQETIINRLWDEYELTYTTATGLKTEVDKDRASVKYLEELKRKIRALGSVNMESIEEYQRVKERFEFLSEQTADLEKSKSNLHKVIESMQVLMQENFERQFAVINESFGEVFTELFGGGKGKLSLSNPDDILESGIEIEVQLPGKGLQNISLYSGGEKSFIATALLFAILKVKPTPFCILDEIDAALDDVNVSRFATYLKNYLNETQFIVITHRRGTMEAAHLMYGVTMQEKGVSKLLSLRIDDIIDEIAK